MKQQSINTRPTSHIRLTVSQHTEDEYDKWLQAVVQASSLVKLVDSCTNNAAWAACLDAYEYLKPLPRFRQQVKGGDTAGYGYKRAFKALKKLPARPHLRLREPLLPRRRHDRGDT